MSMEVHVVASSFTPAQQREIALCYVKLGRGEKTPYAESLGLQPHVIRKWISALADGDLDNERFPRKTGSMTKRDISEVERRRKLLAQQQAQAEREQEKLVRKLAEHSAQAQREREEFARQLALKDAEASKWEKAADALGKAIAVLHDLGEPHGKAEKSSQ